MASQGFQQVQRQTQSLVLAPQLRQSLKILQVPTMELRNVVLEELQINPTLEEMPMDTPSLEAPESVDNGSGSDYDDSDDSDFSSSGDSEPEPDRQGDGSESSESLDFSDEFAVLQKLDEDWKEYFSQEAGEFEYSSDAEARRKHFFDSITSDASLQENLMEQARLTESDDQTLSALELLIGSLDNNGFLSSNLSDIALLGDVPLKVVQQTADLLKSLDPPGIGAENLHECLLLQLKSKNLSDSLPARIIRDHWNLLLRRRVPEIARKLHVSTEEVHTALKTISELDPAPGRRFSDDENFVVEPDVEVYKDETGEWQVILNNTYIPRLRISQAYKDMLAKGQLKGKEREYVRDKFRSGKFLISSIEQRQQTIERITREILKRQIDFFEHGSSQLRPLTMSQVADTVGVHETTVSRAIANKYIRTPHGVFDLKYFFTPGYAGEDGRAVSNTSVKERIARIIESEPSRKPYSDQAIVQILEEEGVKIARRTVAKYREELGILPTNLRRQYD